MRGFIVAAGFGTRLKPITEHIPKALVPVCGMPMLQRNYDFFRSHGIENIAVNIHYLHSQIEEYCRSHLKATLFHETPNILGTGGALYNARQFLTEDDTFVVFNADILTTVNLSSLIEKFEQSNALIAFVADSNTTDGNLQYHKENGQFVALREEGKNHTGESANFIGLALYRKEFVDYLNEETFCIKASWKAARDNGERIFVFTPDNFYWKDTGTITLLHEIHMDYLNGKINIPIPEDLIKDQKRNSVYHQNAQVEGSFCWVSTPSVVPQTISHSVVIHDTDVIQSQSVHTEWGTFHA